jgi:hypothetical protein
MRDMGNLKNDPIKFIEEYCGSNGNGSGREFKLLPYQEALIEKLRQPDVHLSIVSMIRHPGRLTRMLVEAMLEEELEQGEPPAGSAGEISSGEWKE